LFQRDAAAIPDRKMVEVLEVRNEKRSTIATSQISIKEFYDIIGEKTIV